MLIHMVCIGFLSGAGARHEARQSAELLKIFLLEKCSLPNSGVPQVYMVNGIKNSTNDEHVGNLVVTQADVPHVFRLREEEQKVIIHALMNSVNDFFYLQRCWVEFHD